jgi:glycogen debranching enzyme
MLAQGIQLQGQTFIPKEEANLPEWGCVLGDLPQPLLTLKDNDLFMLTDHFGTIGGCAFEGENNSMGLFCHDTRFLSRLELQLEKHPPILLSSSADKGFAMSVLCTNPRLDKIPAETIGIKRELVLNGGLFESISVTNYGTEEIDFELSLSFDADFADLFEVRGAIREKRGQQLRQAAMPQGTSGHPEAPQELILAYQGVDQVLRESRIEFQDTLPTEMFGTTAVWKIHLASHTQQNLSYRLRLYEQGKSISQVNAPMHLSQAKAAEMQEAHNWQTQTTAIQSDRNTFNRLIDRAQQDIYLLRQSFTHGESLSAGVPWFSTLFGRDSIIAASQVLMVTPNLARETLKLLAHYQGKSEDEWRDEQPGKILHEIRFGEMARCNEIPHTPYYGTIDATPLWLMLYVEYFAWTADHETIDALWPNALAAMAWVDREMGDSGYLAYNRKSSRGLQNQGWKDSGDCIVNRRGEMAQGAIALCEVQAYVYAAKLRLANIARMKQQIDLADRWETEAHSLKERFNVDFWLSDQDFCALALDGDRKPVDSITSNPGHCLGLGIFTPENAYSVAERLRAPDMFSGWGIRTLSSLSPAYNPMGYHVGSIWPHDNSMTVLGLRSLGLVDQALEISQGLLDMTQRQPYYRPPELFCGFERSADGDAPIRYPVACSPQAWATGSLFQLIQAMVNLVPDAPGNYLRIIDPALPESINYLSLKNLQIGTTLLDLEFERSGSSTACRVSKKRGNLRVVIEA